MDDAARFDELCHSYLMHFNTPGSHWYVNGPGKRYQAHAQYAQGRPNPDAKIRGGKETDGSSSVKGMTQYPKQTFKDLKKLSGPPDYNSRMEINHPSVENGSDVGRHYNCPNCAAAFDMQERGYDVFARPSKNGLHPADVEAMFKGGDLRGVHNEMSPRVTSKLSKLYGIAESDYGRRGKGAWNQYSSILSRQQQRTADYTIQAIRSQGINNRGVIVVGWLGDPSFKDRTTSYHAFNYKTNNGVVTFYDTQSKQKDKINGFSTEQADKGFFTEIDPREVYLMRTSDVEPSEAIMSAVYSPDRSVKHSYLTHSGVKNMHWRQHDPNKRWQSHAVYAQGRPNPDAKVRGERPSDNAVYSDRKVSSKQFSHITGKLVDELNNDWSYGVIHNGKKIEDVSDFDFSKYRTTPVENLKNTKTGTCWDFVNYQHAYLNEKGIPNKSYMLVSRYGDGPDDVKTHTFTVAKNQGKLYWIESAWWPERGVHNIRSPKEVAEKACIFNGKVKPYDLYEFNPTGMDKGLTSNEYFDMATQNLLFTTANERLR